MPNWKIYGERYKQNRTKKTSFEFQWPKIEGKRLNQHLLPDLMAMTDDHCAYCDGSALKKGDKTIDHFKPKSNPKFYLLVCKWVNLYPACSTCQQSKWEQFDKELLRPDEIGYEFNKYFIYNFSSHSIDPNPSASLLNQRRAQTTIRILDLNDSGMCKSRLRDWNLYWKSLNPVLSDYNFRFMFE